MKTYKYSAIYSERRAHNGELKANTPEEAPDLILDLARNCQLADSEFVDCEEPDNFILTDEDGEEFIFDGTDDEPEATTRPAQAGQWETWADYDEEGENGRTIIGQNPASLKSRILFVSLRDATPKDIATAKAAPELLAALKDLFDDWLTLTNQDFAEGNEDVIRLTEAAAAAIAAAEPSEADQLPAA